MKPSNKHLRRILSDWTFVGAVIVTVALIVSISIGRMTPSITTLGVLLAFWIITLVLVYARILEVLEETKSSRLEVLREVKKLQAESRNMGVNQTLPAISMEDMVLREAQLEDGDSVLVFANTLEVNFQPMFDVVVGNLEKGVTYKYILFEDEQIDDWGRFNRMLKKQGITNLPEAIFEQSHIATLLRASTAIYDYEDTNKSPEGFCVLATTHGLDTCIVLSPTVAKQTRDAFYKVWRLMREGKPPKNIPPAERAPHEELKSSTEMPKANS